MSEPREQPAAPPLDGEEVRLLDLLLVVAREKRLVLAIALAAAVLTAGATLLMRNVYTARTKVLAPKESLTTEAMLLGPMGITGGLGMVDWGITDPNEVYVEMLKTQRVADRLIARFDLQNVYRQKYLTYTRRKLAENTSIRSTRSGVITIAVDDHEPQRAAHIAAAYVEELQRLLQELATQEAHQRREFYGQQLAAARASLEQAEAELRKVQQREGLIEPDAQARALVQMVAAMQAEVTAKQVQLRGMQMFATPRNPDVMMAREELKALEAKLASLSRQEQQAGRGSLTAAAGEYIQRMREVKYFEVIVELLARQYEGARIDETSRAGGAQVIDPAVPPELKSRPYRALLTLAGLFLGLLLGAVFVVAREKLAADHEQMERLRELRHHLRLRRG